MPAQNKTYPLQYEHSLNVAGGAKRNPQVLDFVCISYVLFLCIGLYLYVSVFFSHVSVFYPHVTRMLLSRVYSYVLVCIRVLLVCYPYVLV